MKGLFISFEGNDGSGKSSALESILKELKDMNMDVIYSREPGGSYIAEKIRDIILDKDNLGMDPITEALLYAASRREHIQKTIIPAVDSGKIVLCDRFLDSSLAYQGFARDKGMEYIYNLNQFATEGLLPDLTILVCVRPEVGLARINRSEREKDRLELEKMDFHQRVYDGYIKLSQMYPDRIKVIDGEKSREEVLKEVEDIVLPFIKDNLK